MQVNAVEKNGPLEPIDLSQLAVGRKFEINANQRCNQLQL